MFRLRITLGASIGCRERVALVLVDLPDVGNLADQPVHLSSLWSVCQLPVLPMWSELVASVLRLPMAARVAHHAAPTLPPPAALAGKPSAQLLQQVWMVHISLREM